MLFGCSSAASCVSCGCLVGTAAESALTPDPKIMPSEVSTERILWSMRLWNERKSWSRNFIVPPQIL